MGFADGFFKGRQLKLQAEQQKLNEKLANLKIREATLRLGQMADERAARARQQAAQERLFAAPEFRNLSQSGALAAQEETNPGVISGPDAPDTNSVVGRLAQMQTDKTRDLIQSGMLDEFKKLNALKLQEKFLQGGFGQGGGGGGFNRQSTAINPMTGSMTITSQQVGPVIRNLDDTSVGIFDPNTGQLLETIDRSDPEREERARDREYVPESELQNILYIDRANQTVRSSPIGVRRGELNNENFIRVNPDQKKRLQALQNAFGIIDQLERSAAPVFQAQAGLLERGIAGGEQAWERIIQSNPALTLYSSQSQGFLSQLARALGEVGTLTDQDIGRSAKLVPRLVNIFGLPDTKDVAEAKIEGLRSLLQAQYNSILGQKVFDVKTPKLDELIKDAPESNIFTQGKEAVGKAERGAANEVGDRLNKMGEDLINRFGLRRK